MKLFSALATIFLCGLLSANDITPTTQKISAFAIPKDMITINANLNYLDNEIDIFHSITKDKDYSYGSLGKMDGFDLFVGYGFHKHISIFYNMKFTNVNYMDDKLSNIKNEIFARVNFYDVPNYIFDDFTIDIGLTRNGADTLSINNKKALSSIVAKTKLPIEDTLSPTIKISDLYDNSFFLRAIWGNKFSSSLINLYTGLRYSDIGTTISSNSSQSSRYSKNQSHKIDAGRSEKSIYVGANFLIESENFIYDFDYHYLRLFSRDGGDHNHNNIFDIKLAYKANRALLLYLGNTIMLNGFNGVIPYLYNKYTDDSFGSKYGYFKFGIVYNFAVNSFDRSYLQNNHTTADSLANYLY